MDPLTQGVIGAALPQAVTRHKKQIAIAGLFGLLGAVAPDLDILIFSKTDPLLFLEYHRQFSHSLFFIPFGGFVCGLILYLLLGKRWGLTLFLSVAYCSLGYATHALLDACTSYGTQLFWPFSNVRIAWNTMPVVDPLYTLPILILVVLAAVRKNALLARLALAWILVYPGIGLLQRDRAEAAGWELANQRGHKVVQLKAKPSFGNIVVWKVVYETEQRYYVDAVRVALSKRYYYGDSVEKLDIARDLPWLDSRSQQANDLQRFKWFSNGYIAKDPNNAYRLIDVRYSLVPNEIAEMWSIELSRQAKQHDHVVYRSVRELTIKQRQAFLSMLLGRDL